MLPQVLPLSLAGLVLAGCATWSHSEVTPPRSAGAPLSTTPTAFGAAGAPPVATRAPVDPTRIVLTEGDIGDRPYETLGDLSVTVNKTTIFHPDPTRELVADKLREEAAKLGADAVVLVRYGTVGISFMSWGSLDGRGRAVAFKR